MPEITFNFNVNVNLTCDPAILNFLKMLQRVKPVEPEKIASVPFIQTQTDLKQPYPESVTTSTSNEYKMGSVVIFSEDKKEKKPKKQYKLGGERISDDVLDQRIIDYITINQPCSLVWDKKTGTFPEDFLNSLKFYGSTKVRQHLINLEKRGLIFRERPSQKGSKSGTGRKPYIYSIPKKQSENNQKALSYFKEKLVEEYEEDDEDVIRGETAIEVPSPERRPRREIKRKCLKCGGQLWKRYTEEDNYLDPEARFLDFPNQVYYQCINCGSIFKEKNEEAKAA